MRASPPILGRLDPGTRRCVIRRSTDPSTERGLRSRTLDCVAGHLPKLSKQQQRVLSYIGKGYTTAQIAERLGVGHDTASVYVSKAITFVRERGRRRADEPMTLTRRERDVRTLLQNGLSNADMATLLGIGRRTAETHVGNVAPEVRREESSGPDPIRIVAGFECSAATRRSAPPVDEGWMS
jgi:DNA-binding NarL/FixJ family response regulator